MTGKAHDWGTFPKCKVELNYHLVLGLLFWECPSLGLTLYKDKFMNLCIYIYPTRSKTWVEQKNRNSLFKLIHVRLTYFYTSYLSLRMEIIVDTFITKTQLGRARGSSLFCLGYSFSSKIFNYIAKDASILHLKLGSSNRPSYLHPFRTHPNHHGQPITSSRLLTWRVFDN
jgi:hypothetical protein